MLLEVSDTAGQERYRTLTTKYFRDAVGVLIVFDLTEAETFKKSLKQWVTHIERYGPQDITRVLIGNKLDLEDSRAIATDDMKEFASSYGMKSIETSAKDAKNVDQAFELLVRQILKTNNIRPTTGSEVDFGSKGKKGGCC